jgi:hypothetical protein
MRELLLNLADSRLRIIKYFRELIEGFKRHLVELPAGRLESYLSGYSTGSLQSGITFYLTDIPDIPDPRMAIVRECRSAYVLR